MAIGTLAKLSTKGIRGELMARIGQAPEIWKNHCTMVDSTTKVEPFGWAGSIPMPREMVGGRVMKELRAFTYDITNKTYELSVMIPREWFEDDQTGQIKRRIGEIASMYGMYKSYLFSAMLANGATGLGWDGNTFFDDTRTVGSSGAIDNDLTSAAATGTIPTSAEFLAQFNVIKTQMLRFLDDQGNPKNWAASTKIRVIAPPSYDFNIREALNATTIAATSNVHTGIAELDIDPFNTADTNMYVHMVGQPDSLGIIHQQRTPLEILIYNDPYWMDANDGLVITLRERFVFAYGNFYVLARQVWS